MNNITTSLRSIFDSIKMLEVKLNKDKATKDTYRELMLSMSDLYISLGCGYTEIRKYIDIALGDIENSLNVFERDDYYENDLRGIHLDMACVNIRAALYFSQK
ncbi:hypothetical protein 65p186 [Aeromonas phage 65]|uniref:Uncharacterized protein n=2 Tax=Ishigurovirus osborne TaxID=260149 RepID=A0A219YC34_9CAUD|nr:hypothetical protein ST65p186 [Aeromonas phage 65]ADQ53194.1 hypothetical protein 65p186 [Aeromonas phage 65]APU01571.1 hypothetical protein [Aeromonas phage 65.2]